MCTDDVQPHDAVAVASSQSETDFSDKEVLSRIALGEMIYQFLSQAIEIKSDRLIDNLKRKSIISLADIQQIRKQKKSEDKANNLLQILRNKSSIEFESFLTTLAESGHQSVAGVVRRTIRTDELQGQNPLQYGNVLQFYLEN